MDREIKEFEASTALSVNLGRNKSRRPLQAAILSAVHPLAFLLEDSI